MDSYELPRYSPYENIYRSRFNVGSYEELITKRLGPTAHRQVCIFCKGGPELDLTKSEKALKDFMAMRNHLICEVDISHVVELWFKLLPQLAALHPTEKDLSLRIIHDHITTHVVYTKNIFPPGPSFGWEHKTIRLQEVIPWETEAKLTFGRSGPQTYIVPVITPKQPVVEKRSIWDPIYPLAAYEYGILIYDDNDGKATSVSPEWCDQAIAWYGKHPGMMVGMEIATARERMKKERPDIEERLKLLRKINFT